MAKRNFNQAERYAIFTVHGEKCWICGEPVSLLEVEIDHIIPESLEGTDKAVRALELLGLPKDFDLNGWANLKPAHPICNGKKNDHVFKPSVLMQLELEKGIARAAKVQEAFESFVTDRKLSKAISIVLQAAENDKLVGRNFERIAELVSAKADPFREPAMQGKPFALAPHLKIVGEDGDRYWLKGPGGMAGYRPKNATDISWDCPNCGPTGWNGSRCITCGHFIDPD